MKIYEEIEVNKDPEDFVSNVSTILDILIKYRYVEEIDSSVSNPYNRMCVRTKESIFLWI
jgi:hypothetical protein